MKTILILVVAAFCSQIAFPYTVQEKDTLRWGGPILSVLQYPMEPKIRDVQQDAGKHLLRPNRSTNFRAYVASWRIIGDSLYLVDFEGVFGDESVPVSTFIDADELPVKATWYSGVLQAPIGEFDFDTQSWPFILEVTVEKGTVTNTRMVPNGKERFKKPDEDVDNDVDECEG